MMSQINWKQKASFLSYLRFLTIFFVIVLVFGNKNQAFGQSKTTTVKIECRAPQADFVTIIWGFNGWQIPDGFSYSPPTIIEKKTLRTPLQRKQDTFRLEIELPVGKILNWGLLIGKNESPKNKYFAQKTVLIDSMMSPLIIEEELTATDEELGLSYTYPWGALSLIGFFLMIGFLFMFSNLGKAFGFEPYGDYELSVPMNSQLTYTLLIIVAIFHIIVLAGSAGFTHYYRHLGEDWGLGGPIKYFLVQFSLASENNASVWYSSMIFLLTGLVALLTFWGVYNVRDNKAQIRTSWGWLILAALFIALSADELGSFHERLGMLGTLNPTGDNAPGWVDLFAIPGGIIGLFMLWFFFQNFRRQKKSFFILLLGIVALLSVLLQEDFEIDSLHASVDPETWQRPIWQILLEEGSELLAVWCFLGAFVNLVYRLSLQKSLQNSLAAPEIIIPIKPALLIGLSFCLVAFGVFGVEIISPLMESLGDPQDNGITRNWFPSMLAFIGSVLSWLIWNAEKGKKESSYLVLGLILLALSVYYGGAFRIWFSKIAIKSITALMTFEILILLGGIFFAWKKGLKFPQKWQTVFYIAWLIGCAIAMFYPDNSVGLRDIWPFAFLLPVLLAAWMRKAIK